MKTTTVDSHLASATADAITTEFGVKEYVVTPGCLCCLTLCPQTLTLEAEEVVFKQATPCDTKTKRMPYGQLGSVDKQTQCGCCIGVDSNLTKGGDEVSSISPGLGCQTELVEEIVAELKARVSLPVSILRPLACARAAARMPCSPAC